MRGTRGKAAAPDTMPKATAESTRDEKKQKKTSAAGTEGDGATPPPSGQPADVGRSSRHAAGDSNEPPPSRREMAPPHTPKKAGGKNQVTAPPAGTSSMPRKRGRPRKDKDQANQASDQESQVESQTSETSLLDPPLSTQTSSIVAGSSQGSSDLMEDVASTDISVEEESTGKGEGKSEDGDQSSTTSSQLSSQASPRGHKGRAAVDAGAESAADTQPEDQNADMFSPRRSGRGVVPNRRFQDMELNYGCKRPKEEPGTPGESSPRKRTKKVTSSQAKRQGKRKEKEEEDQEQSLAGEAAERTDAEAKGCASDDLPAAAQNSSTDDVTKMSEPVSVTSSALEEILQRSTLAPATLVEAPPAAVKTVLGAASQTTIQTKDSSLPQMAKMSLLTTVLSEAIPSEQTSQAAQMNLEAVGRARQQVSARRVISVAVSSSGASSKGSPSVVSGVSPSQMTVVASGKGKVMAVRSPGRVVVTSGSAITTTGVTASPAKIIIKPPSLRNVISTPASTKGPSALTQGGVRSSTAGTGTKVVYVSKDSTSDYLSSEEETSPSKTTPASPRDVMYLVEVAPNKSVPVVIGDLRENSTGKLTDVTLPSQSMKQDSQQADSSHQGLPTSQSSEISASGALQAQSSSADKQVASSDSQESCVVTKMSSACVSALSTASSVLQPPASSQQATAVRQVVVVHKPATQAQQGMVQPAQSGTQDISAQHLEDSMQQGADAASSKSPAASKTHEFSVDTSGSESNEGSDSESTDPKSSKFATSGTQTPYHKKNTQDVRKLITVRVQPPPPHSQQADASTSTSMTVAVVKKEVKDEIHDIAQADEEEEIIRSGQGFVKAGSKQEYIFVNVPEGSTVKQQYVQSRDKLEDDSFYTVDDQGLYHCHVCDYKTDRKPNFYKHKRKHFGIRPHRCEICNYCAATSSNLKRHLAIHADLRNYRCPFCSLNFRQKIHLERHIKYKHEEKKVKCPLCDYVCANENPDLKVHIRRKHVPMSGVEGAKDAFTCQECGLLAMSKRDLRQHAKFHSKGPELKLFCQMCSFVTDCESRLRRHQYIHTKEKPFQCGLCDYRGSQKEHVLRHMRSQHNIEIVRKHRAKKDAPATSTGKSSSEEGSPRVAERADYTSEEKIFACNHCTMKFAKLINLYKHLHTQHRDIMPSDQGDFACVVCDFHTTNKKNLLVHMRKHNMTDQCPPSHVYSCVLCRYMNPKRRNLFQHMRKKHHIEIVIREDGTTTCFVANDALTLPGTSGGPSGVTLPSGSDANIALNMMSLSDVITTVSRPLSSELHFSREDGTITVNSASVMPTMVKMEDLAMVVSNPNSSVGSDGCVVVEGAGAGESLSMGSLTQNDAAEAIQGLQALAERGVLDSNSVVEEQVQVMAADEQATLIIDPTTLGVVEQLVQPKTEPLEVVEIDESQLLDEVNSTATTMSEDDSSILDGSAPVSLSAEDGGLQLSAEQLMNLATGDYIEINGEMYKVEVSNSEGAGGQQVISIEPASLPEQMKQQQPEKANSQ